MQRKKSLKASTSLNLLSFFDFAPTTSMSGSQTQIPATVRLDATLINQLANKNRRSNLTIKSECASPFSDNSDLSDIENQSPVVIQQLPTPSKRPNRQKPTKALPKNDVPKNTPFIPLEMKCPPILLPEKLGGKDTMKRKKQIQDVMVQRKAAREFDLLYGSVRPLKHLGNLVEFEDEEGYEGTEKQRNLKKNNLPTTNSSPSISSLTYSVAKEEEYELPSDISPPPRVSSLLSNKGSPRVERPLSPHLSQEDAITPQTPRRFLADGTIASKFCFDTPPSTGGSVSKQIKALRKKRARVKDTKKSNTTIVPSNKKRAILLSSPSNSERMMVGGRNILGVATFAGLSDEDEVETTEIEKKASLLLKREGERDESFKDKMVYHLIKASKGVTKKKNEKKLNARAMLRQAEGANAFKRLDVILKEDEKRRKNIQDDDLINVYNNAPQTLLPEDIADAREILAARAKAEGNHTKLLEMELEDMQCIGY